MLIIEFSESFMLSHFKYITPFLLLGLLPPQVLAKNLSTISSKALPPVIVVGIEEAQSEGMRFIEKKQWQSKRPIASLTKLILAHVSADQAMRPECQTQLLPMDRDPIKKTKTQLKEYATYSCKELLTAILTRSDNQAAYALGRHIFGSHDRAVTAMNQFVRSKGLKNTHLVDPAGLYPQNISNAKDLLFLMQLIVKQPHIAQLSLSPTYKVTDVSGEHLSWIKNTNPLIRSEMVEPVFSKTGYTQEAGRNLLMQYKTDSGKTVSLVILGITKPKQREQIALEYIKKIE